MTAAEILGANGPFVSLIEGFSPRPVQLELARAVEKTLVKRQTLIAESGTGTGKTFAYLVPVLQQSGKVLLSTGTRHLQDQLFFRDLPQVRQATGSHSHAVILKGRANYLCHYRLANCSAHPAYDRAQMQAQLDEILHWSVQTEDGDIAEVSGVLDTAAIWPLITSTTDNCLGSKCPDFKRCHVQQVRNEAQEADLVVINHHLFFSDLLLQEQGFGRILPDTEATVFDEAHLLPDIASRFLGQSVSTRQFLLLAQDSLVEERLTASAVAELPECAYALETASARFRMLLPSGSGRMGEGEVFSSAKQDGSARDLLNALRQLTACLEVIAEVSDGLHRCWQRSQQLLEVVGQLREHDKTQVAWLEYWPQSFRWHLTPLDIAARLQQTFAADQAWVFTSATLAVKQDLQHFEQQLGLKEANFLCLESPFDFSRQSLAYMPEGLPEPADPDYTRMLMERVKPVLEAAAGGAFLLFTSYQAMTKAWQILQHRLQLPMKIQGQESRQRLLDWFRNSGNAVLFATASFWEGVDVKGSALRAVMLDKLPFASPSDPLTQARIRMLRDRGKNPFTDFQLPHAVIRFKQGAGRLIRDVNDRGVLVLADPRLRRRHYGRIFCDSIPQIPVTSSIEEVEAFLHSIEISGQQD